MNAPKVSIITPVHNSSEFIAQTIQSVLAQTFTDWEMIIVDDCSTDDSFEIVQSFSKKDSRIKNHQLSKNSGAAIARNTAIEKAQGRYIAFLDSDDLWLPNKLEEQISFMEKNKFPFTFTAYYKVDEEGKIKGKIDVPAKVDYHDLLKTCSIGCLTAVYDTEILGKIFMPNIARRQDYGLWLRILKVIPLANGLNQPLAQYRVRKTSLSGNKLKAARYQWKVYREVEKISFLKSIYYFINYFFAGFIKTYLNKK